MHWGCMSTIGDVAATVHFSLPTVSFESDGHPAGGARAERVPGWHRG